MPLVLVERDDSTAVVLLNRPEALNALSDELMDELVATLSEFDRDEGVRCNALLPSVIDTPANRAAMPDADHTRWVAPAQLAATIAFLCSEEGAATSGAAIPVYGRA